MSIIANMDINLRGNAEGIDRAAGKTSATMDGLSKKVETAKAAIGSTLGSLLGGIAGPIGVLLGGIVGKAASAMGELIGSARDMSTRFAQASKLGFDQATVGIYGAFAALGVSVSNIWLKVIKAAMPLWSAISDGVQSVSRIVLPILDQVGDGIAAVAGQVTRLLKPVIEWVASFAAGAFFTLKAIIDLVTESIKPLWQWLGKTADQWVISSNAWPDGGEVAIKALREVAVAGAEIYEAVVALPARFKILAGRVIARLSTKALSKLGSYADFWANLLPGVFGRRYEELSRELARLNVELVRFGASLEAEGQRMIEGAGRGLAEEMRSRFDTALEKNKKRDRTKQDESGKIGTGSNTSAVERGSLEAFKIIAGDREDKSLRVANEQLAVWQKMLDEVREKKVGGRAGKAAS